ncbi:hypothetical protein [Campylobacter majalis]|uniref:hypothetical protein n=1 Tax=Campylobacter majalis TaxID=2790656 RepID=UPI003D69C922
MQNIQLLKAISKTKLIKSGYSWLLGDMDSCMNILEKKYDKHLLSNFDVVLSEKDERVALLSDRYFMYNQEKNYIDFILKIFEKNDNCCIIDTHFTSINYEYFLSYLNSGIDIKFQYLLLHQYIHFIGKKNRFFKIDDKDLLVLFFLFSLREQPLSQFFLFPKDEICLVSNYDCLFPMFFKQKSLVANYSLMAKEAGLYIIK